MGCCGTKTDVATVDVKEAVRTHYAAAAVRTKEKGSATCCDDRISRRLYDEIEAGQVPAEALAASLGCGNPTLLAQLNPGETVLDLGSGGGIDVLLSARRVGPHGKAYGLDMTDEMLELARENARKAGAANVEFLKGEIEKMPLPDGAVDVIISNCVINLSVDKPAVLREAFRVLKPGGRFAVSDVVRRRDIPEEVARDIELWAGCIAGALSEAQYRQYLADAGFVGIDVEPTRIYDEYDGAYMSAFIRARKG